MVVQTHEGKAALFYEDLVKDKIVVLNFMYLNCEDDLPDHAAQPDGRAHAACSRASGATSSCTRSRSIRSATAWPRCRKEARSHGVRPGWLFLRASPQDTELLRRKLGFVSSDPEVDANKSAHAAMVRFGNEPRQLWSMVSAFASPEAIARAIRWVA